MSKDDEMNTHDQGDADRVGTGDRETDRAGAGDDMDRTERIEPQHPGGPDDVGATGNDRATGAGDDDPDATMRIETSGRPPAADDDATTVIPTAHPWEADDEDEAVETGPRGSGGTGAAAPPPGPVDLPEEKSRNPWLGIVVRTLIVVVVLGGLYVGLAQYFGGRIPGGTTVNGNDIGGLTPEAAQERLEGRLGPLTNDPVVVIADGERYEVLPEDAGLSLDIDGTIEGLTGVSYDPRVLWRQITGSDYNLDVIARTDVQAVRAQIQGFADEITNDPVEGSVELVQGTVQQTPSEDGLALDVNETAELIVQGWPETREVTGVTAPVEPELTNEEIDRFVSEEAEPALSAAIVVEVDDESAVISENQIARLLSVVRHDDNTLALEFDEETMLEIVRDGTGDAVSAPRDAQVRLGDNGQPEIVPAREGAELEDDAVVEAVLAVLTNPDPDARTVQVDTVTVEPELTTEDAEGWNFEVMSDFSSEYPTGASNEDRTHNLRVGMGHINGVVLMPGEQFSLGETLSPINADHGYVEAGVISDGRLVQGMGGGLSQVSTTVLNAAWDAGVQLDEFRPHSYYISRYPEGKEATLAVGVIDNRWTNDTDSPIVLQAWVDDGSDSLRMRFWGDPQYEVETITSARSNIVQPGSSTDDSPGCLPQSAEVGFDVTVTRVLSQGGDEVTRESYFTRYQPSDAVTCV